MSSEASLAYSTDRALSKRKSVPLRGRSSPESGRQDDESRGPSADIFVEAPSEPRGKFEHTCRDWAMGKCRGSATSCPNEDAHQLFPQVVERASKYGSKSRLCWDLMGTDGCCWSSDVCGWSHDTTETSKSRKIGKKRIEQMVQERPYHLQVRFKCKSCDTVFDLQDDVMAHCYTAGRCTGTRQSEIASRPSYLEFFDYRAFGRRSETNLHSAVPSSLREFSTVPRGGSQSRGTRDYADRRALTHRSTGVRGSMAQVGS